MCVVYSVEACGGGVLVCGGGVVVCGGGVCMFCLIPVMKLWVFFLFLPESDTVKFLPLPKPVSP